jgi:5-methylcytosine-specific restriction protein A
MLHCGRCHLCGLKIDAGQEWEVSHPIPLAAGGDDVASNRAPAHKRCHAKQTATIDAPLIAKVRRQHQKHIGAKPKSRAWSTRFRKKMDGTVVPALSRQR